MNAEEAARMDLLQLAAMILDSGGPSPEFIESFVATTTVDWSVAALLQHTQLAIRWYAFGMIRTPSVEVLAAEVGGDMRLQVLVSDRATQLAPLQLVFQQWSFRDIEYKPDGTQRDANTGKLVFVVPEKRVHVLRSRR